MLLRTDLPPVHVAVDQTTNTNGGGVTTDVFVVGSLHTKNADFTYEAGTRLTIGKILGRDVANRDHGIEFTFLGLFDYSGRAALVPANVESGLGIISLLGSNEVDAGRLGQGFGFPFINPRSVNPVAIILADSK